MIATRLSGLSTSENEFDAVKGPYVQALKNAGYENQDLKYEKPTEYNKKKS